MFEPRIQLHRAVDVSLLEKMHEKALEILEEIGMKVSNERILKKVEGIKGFKIEDGRVKIKPELVETLVDEYRVCIGKEERKRTDSSDETTILSIGYPGCTHIIDLETGELKLLTTNDLIAATKLIDSLYDWGVRGGAPGAPQDVPVCLSRILQCKIGYEYSRSADYAPFENYVEAEYIRRMAKVVGQKFNVDVYVVSPLRLEGVSVDRAIPLLEEGTCEGLSVSSMPLAGATAPIYPIGAFTQGIAESIGGYVILHEAYPEIPMWFGVGAFHFDMKHGNIVFGSPEQTLIDLVGVAINQFYGKKAVYGIRSFRTNARKVDAQAQVEKAVSATVGVLTGPGQFIHSGLLSTDEVFSPVQLVIDCEIARYLSRLAKGIDFSEEDLESSLDIIRNCAMKGTFLTDRATLGEYRRIYWQPDLFDYSLLHTSSREMKDLIERARDIARKKIAEHSFQLEEDKKRRLEGIYREAVRRLTSASS